MRWPGPSVTLGAQGNAAPLPCLFPSSLLVADRTGLTFDPCTGHPFPGKMRAVVASKPDSAIHVFVLSIMFSLEEWKNSGLAPAWFRAKRRGHTQGRAQSRARKPPRRRQTVPAGDDGERAGWGGTSSCWARAWRSVLWRRSTSPRVPAAGLGIHPTSQVPDGSGHMLEECRGGWRS